MGSTYSARPRSKSRPSSRESWQVGRAGWVLVGLLGCFTRAAAAGECEHQKIVPLDAGQDDQFGFHVALDGNTAVIGAREHDLGGCGSSPQCDYGAVYVYDRNTTTGDWELVTQLTAPSPTEGDRFGFSVDIAGDTIVVGADQKNTGRSGAAFVFERSVGVWSLSMALAGESSGDLFGHAVATRGDLVVVGSPGWMGFQGNVKIYSKSSGWAEIESLSATLPTVGDEFGFGLSIEGSVLAVTAIQDGHPARTGYADIFSEIAGVWTHTACIDPVGLMPGDQFGRSVDLSGDRVAIGALFADGVAADSGTVHVYAYQAMTSAWTLEQTLEPPDPRPVDRFGQSVALEADRLLVGAPLDDESCPQGPVCDAGAVYLYQFNTLTHSWDHETTLTPLNPGVQDFFGYGVALDPSVALIGAYGRDDNGQETGSCYVFDVGRTSPAASWTNYGSGCPGTLGAPTLTLSDIPAICTEVSLQLGNSRPGFALGMLLIGFAPVNLTICPGCEILVTPVLSKVLPISAAGAVLTGKIPCDCALAGAIGYAQVLVQDPAGCKGLAYSPGLQMNFGF